MWKIFFVFDDNSKCTLTGKHKEIPLELAVKYQKQYDVHAVRATYQQYPKKDYPAMELVDKIESLQEERQNEQCS